MGVKLPALSMELRPQTMARHQDYGLLMIGRRLPSFGSLVA